MITGTKILLQPPYRGGFALSHAEADARLAFFLTYFDQVVPLTFNPPVMGGQILLVSTELEQRFTRLAGMSHVRPPVMEIDDINSNAFLDGMAGQALAMLNDGLGGFALASREGFSGVAGLEAVDRIVLLLENCLPAPHYETPLEELLAFKVEHEGLLRSFHEAVEDLYYGIGNRPLDTLLPRLKDKLDAHVEQVLLAYESRGLRSYMGMLKIALKLAPPMIGELIGLAAGVPMVGGIAGGVIGLATDRVKLPTDGNAVPKDFEYVLSGLEAGHRTAFPHEPVMAVNFVGPNVTQCRFPGLYPDTPTPPSNGNFSGVNVSHSVYS